MRAFTRYDVEVSISVRVKTDQGREVGSFIVHGDRIADSDLNPLSGGVESAVKDAQTKVSPLAEALESVENNPIARKNS